MYPFLERKDDTMAKLNIRNRNKGKFDKEGKPKAPNWEYRFEAAKVAGKRQHVSKAGFKTKKEAEVAGARALAEYTNAGTQFEPSEISVSDYMDYWLKNYCSFNVADSTMTAYRNIINNHIKPRIGHYMLKSISTMVLQEMINDIYVSRGFTKSFMKNILKVTKGSFAYAKKTAKLIKDDPAEDVELPTMSSDSDPDEIIILTKEDVNRILERFEKAPATYYAILTAYYTGLRVSEVYGLTWDCVDFEKKQIKPLFPFGFGLSYTDFEISDTKITANEEHISVSTKVKNIGKTYGGKEVIQLYVSQPQEGLVTPVKSLVAFAKTKTLLPGEEQSVTITFDMKSLAVFDEETASYIINILYISAPTAKTQRKCITL